MNKPRTGKFIKCLNCFKEVYKPLNQLARAKYCSRKCQGLHARIQIKAFCKVCGKKFEHISSRCQKAKYCSRKCYYRSRIINDSGSSEKKCQFCLKIFHDAPSKKRKFCSKECSNKNRMLLRTEPTKANSFRSFWKRRGIIERCEKCGYDKVKQILGIHHIDGNRKNNIRDNLMILCPMCHSLMHRKHIPH